MDRYNRDGKGDPRKIMRKLDRLIKKMDAEGFERPNLDQMDGYADLLEDVEEGRQSRYSKKKRSYSRKKKSHSKSKHSSSSHSSKKKHSPHKKKKHCKSSDSSCGSSSDS